MGETNTLSRSTRARAGPFPAFGLLIGVLSFERGIVSRLLSAGWLVILGEISYHDH
jgi:hypothetical protein